MDEERLTPTIKLAIADFFEPWDLVDFLGISVEEIVENFEDKVIEDLDELLEFIGYGEPEPTTED